MAYPSHMYLAFFFFLEFHSIILKVHYQKIQTSILFLVFISLSSSNIVTTSLHHSSQINSFTFITCRVQRLQRLFVNSFNCNHAYLLLSICFILTVCTVLCYCLLYQDNPSSPLPTYLLNYLIGLTFG